MRVTSEVLEGLASVAEQAGRAVMAVRERGTVAHQSKADHSPVTEADLAADRCIHAALLAAWPQVPVVSEESPLPEGGVQARFFLVDPLDGTREFVAGRDEFTVNIALIEHGVPVAGVVHAPALAETFVGALGLGAWHRDTAGRRPMRVAAGPDAQGWRLVASRSHAGGALAPWLAALPVPYRLLQYGSSLKFCRLAQGMADLYPRLSPTMGWDTAAGHAVLAAAGGAVVDAQGRALRYSAAADRLRNPCFLAYGPEACRSALAGPWPAEGITP